MLYLGQQHMFAYDSGINVEDWNWRKVSDAQVIRGIMAQLHPGAIIQLHDGTNVLGRAGPSRLPARPAPGAAAAGLRHRHPAEPGVPASRDD